MTDTITPRLVVHAVMAAAGSDAWNPEGYEVRTVGLGVAAHLLRMPVASFDCVRVASALADIKGCPVCRNQPGRAA